MISASRAGSSASEASLARSAGVQCFEGSRMFRLRDASDRLDEVAPGVALNRQHSTAFWREAVIATPALSRPFDPLSVNPAALLEAIEERIERRDVKLQAAVRPAFDQLADFVAMAAALFD